MWLPTCSSPAVLKGCVNPVTGLHRWTCLGQGSCSVIAFQSSSIWHCHWMVRWDTDIALIKLIMKDLQCCMPRVRNLLSWGDCPIFIRGTCIVYYIYYVHQRKYLFWRKPKVVGKFHRDSCLDFCKFHTITTDLILKLLIKKRDDKMWCCCRNCAATFNIVNRERQTATIITVKKLDFFSFSYFQ